MRTQANLDALVAQLTMNCGDMFEACREVRISPMFVTAWRRDDKEVHEQLLEAERAGSLRLESEAIRRAVHGVEKGVYYKGERVDNETHYSDGLLQTVLKARLPAYAGNGEGGQNNTFNGPTQINVMPRAEDYTQWLAMRDATVNPRLASPEAMLNSPLEAMDAEYAEVSPFEGLGL